MLIFFQGKFKDRRVSEN